jgi:hypothetical protein
VEGSGVQREENRGSVAWEKHHNEEVDFGKRPEG